LRIDSPPQSILNEIINDNHILIDDDDIENIGEDEDDINDDLLNNNHVNNNVDNQMFSNNTK
jgi:hypothetical protein